MDYDSSTLQRVALYKCTVDPDMCKHFWELGSVLISPFRSEIMHWDKNSILVFALWDSMFKGFLCKVWCIRACGVLQGACGIGGPRYCWRQYSCTGASCFGVGVVLMYRSMWATCGVWLLYGLPAS